MVNIIGLDIGGTKITGVVYNGKKVIKELTIVTPKDLRSFEISVLKLVDFLSAEMKISGVGIGMAGLVDTKAGIVKHSPNMKFVKNLNLVKLFSQNSIKNVKIDNDANCFTRAVMHLGEGRKMTNFLALTFGTGIGGGVVINGNIYRGQNNLGGELGHSVIGDAFFETQYKKLRDKKDFKRAGRLIGKGLASLINIFAPEAIVIGGGYGHNESKKYLPSAKAEISKFLLNKNSTTKIIISEIKNAGAVGATLLVR